MFTFSIKILKPVVLFLQAAVEVAFHVLQENVHVKKDEADAIVQKMTGLKIAAVDSTGKAADRGAFERTNCSAAARNPVAMKGKFRFVDPYGQGDICAAGLVPFFEEGDELHLFLQLEYKDSDGHKHAAFGGKVEAEDSHWTETIVREFGEETGGLLPKEALRDITLFCDNACVHDSCYVSQSKYQMLFYPIKSVSTWRELIPAYAHKYQGATEQGRRGQEFLILKASELATSIPVSAPLKVELQAALSKWRHPKASTLKLPRRSGKGGGRGKGDGRPHPGRTEKGSKGGRGKKNAWTAM